MQPSFAQDTNKTLANLVEPLAYPFAAARRKW